MSTTEQAGEDAVLDAKFSLQVGKGSSRFSVDIELRLARGVMVIFGRSGAGKSLTLKTLVGLVQPHEGHLRVKGRTLFDCAQGVFVAPHQRRIGYVPQHNSLFPFCSVADNVAFGLSRQQRRGKSEVADELIAELGLEHLRDALPEKLSGGERQRVALARALAVRPELLVLDEPFGAIDQEGRHELRAILAKTLRRHDTPAVFVTHDPAEALSLGDEMVKLDHGCVVASGAPAELLPAVQSFHLSAGKVADSQRLASGQSKVSLGDVQLKGPSAVLEASGGQLELDLRLH